MEIAKIKRKNKMYEIIFKDNTKMLTCDDLIIKYNVLYHKDLDEETIFKIKNENNFYDVYNKTVFYINTRLRSEKELRNYLKKYELSENDKDKIIEKLKKINLINDDIFAKAFINDRITFSDYGPLKIKKELVEHNISSTKIDELLDEIDAEIFSGKIKKIISKKCHQNKKYSNNIFKQKILYDLINRGFPKELIIQELEHVNLTNDITTIYNKYYKKLSAKYSGKDLELQIRQKLYKLGYNQEEIDVAKNNQ